MSGPLPIVAIVGRPNVGKSRLFNRYAGASRVLVGNTPGITRDRVVEEIQVSDRSILLVDTAGLDPDAEAGLPAAVQRQALSAVEQADAILFVVDGRTGLLPEDVEIARTLRRASRPLAVAVNKIDSPTQVSRASEFHALGLEPIRPISAEHGGGAFDLLEELVSAIPVAPEPDESSEHDGEGRVRVVVAGRPNVGKSSLVNRLIGEERVVVSEVPGTTRDAVELHLERDDIAFDLIDTAGLRRPGRRDRTAERGSALMTVRALERADVALLVVDAAEGFTDQDAHVASLTRDRGCACVVLANKWDLVPEGSRERVMEAIQHGLRFMSDAPVLRVSALTGARVARIFPAVRSVAAAGARNIATADLNRWLRESTSRHEPSMARRGRVRRPLKFQYATQTGVRPPSFLLFCNDPSAVQTSYRRFLENRLRERFDLAGTPVRLRLRSRKSTTSPKAR